jgi:formate dehydrogenase maturation protein FdhE
MRNTLLLRKSDDMSVLEPEKHFEESRVEVCPVCESRQTSKNITDVDADEDFDYFDFQCHACECVFRVKRYHGGW